MTAWALTSRRAEESPLGDGNPRSRAMAVGEATGPDRGRASKAAAVRAAVTKTPDRCSLVLTWESLAQTFTLTCLVLATCR